MTGNMRKSAAYHDGYLANKYGQPAHTNPYNASEQELYEAWLEGWSEYDTVHDGQYETREAYLNRLGNDM